MSNFKKIFFGLLFLFLIGGLYLVFLRQPQDWKDKPISPFIEHEQNQSSPELLKIALLADSHNSWENLEQAVKQVNQEDFDLVIFLGDLTSLGSPEDFKKGKGILDNLKTPYYIIPGNHDVWWSRKNAKPHDYYFDEVFKDSPYRSKDCPCTCFQEKNLNFILIDNANEQQGIGKSDWQNLESCLQKDLPALVFLHEPIYHPANERVMGQYAAPVATQAARLRQLFCDQKIKLVVAGHLHSFSKYFYDCDNGYQLPMIISGALTNERNFQTPRFLQLTIFDNGKFEEKEILLKD
jgi:predicted phosphodiesterase